MACSESNSSYSENRVSIELGVTNSVVASTNFFEGRSCSVPRPR